MFAFVPRLGLHKLGMPNNQLCQLPLSVFWHSSRCSQGIPSGEWVVKVTDVHIIKGRLRFPGSRP